MKKFLKVTGIVVITALGVVAVGAGIYGNKKTIKSYDRVKAFVANEEDKAQKELEKEQDFENVEVNDALVIVSTKNIVDAYKSNDDKDLKDDEKQILEEAKKIYDAIIKSDMSDYDREKAIYDWMYDNTFKIDGSNVPETEEDTDTLLGAFKSKILNEKNSAMMFRLLANMADLECMVAHDDDNTSVWNICKLDDKCWYSVNIFSDLESSKYWNFNTGKEENDYGMIATKDFPEINGSKYVYSIINSIKIDNPDDIIKKLKESVDSKKNFDYTFAVKSDNQKNVDLARYINEGVSYRITNDSMDLYTPTKEFSKDDYIYFRIAFYQNQEFDVSKLKIDLDKIDKDLDDRFGLSEQY